MLNPNPRTRLSTTSFVSEAAATGFWTANPLSALVEGLDGFELRSEGEKLGLLRLIKETANSGSVPQPFLLYRVLPSLLHSLSLPTAPSSAMLPLVLELGKVVPSSDYGKLVLEPVIRLYSSPDRGTRMALLDGLAEYSDKLDSKTVVEKVWPHLVCASYTERIRLRIYEITGFADTVPVIREATVKAVYPLASKVSLFVGSLLDCQLRRLGSFSCPTVYLIMIFSACWQRCRQTQNLPSGPTPASFSADWRRVLVLILRRRSSSPRLPAV